MRLDILYIAIFFSQHIIYRQCATSVSSEWKGKERKTMPSVYENTLDVGLGGSFRDAHM